MKRGLLETITAKPAIAILEWAGRTCLWLAMTGGPLSDAVLDARERLVMPPLMRLRRRARPNYDDAPTNRLIRETKPGVRTP